MDAKTPFFEHTADNKELTDYFDTLPKAVQETIVQSHGNIQTIGELKALAEGLMNQNQ